MNHLLVFLNNLKIKPLEKEFMELRFICCEIFNNNKLISEETFDSRSEIEISCIRMMGIKLSKTDRTSDLFFYKKLPNFYK